jgi:hypothetical protein
MPKPNQDVRKVDMPMLSQRGVIQGSDPEKRTIELVWTVGAPVLRSNFWGDEWWNEVLSLDPAHVRMKRLEMGTAPFLAVHEMRKLSDQIGVVERAWIDQEKKEGRAIVRFPKAEDDPEADKIFRKILDGIYRNISVGYFPYKFDRQPMAEGESHPTYLAVDWEPFELSLVPVGADPDAVTGRSQPTAARRPCEVINKISADGVIKEDRSMPENEQQNQTPKTPVADPAPAVDVKKERELGTKEERQRVLDIQAAVRTAKLPEEFAADLIKEGVDIAEARKRIIEKWAKDPAAGGDTRNHVTIESGATAGEKFREGASQALIVRSGLGAMVEKHTGKRQEAGEFRGLSMLDLARRSLESAGVSTKGMDKRTIVGLAFTHRDIGGMNGTSDFPVLLENTMHKILLAAYGLTPDTWSRFCRTGSVSDFRAHPRYRKGSFGALDSKNEHGEFKNKQIPDGEKNSLTATSKGNIIALTREAIINDDMGVFSDLTADLGRAAKLTVEVDVFALLALNSGLGPVMADTKTLFHADHGNIGTGAALSAASIDADRVLMASQQDVSGNDYLDLRPEILLLPVGLGGQARVINQSQYDPDTVANKSQMKPNLVAGLYKDIVDTPRISGTRRYSFASKDIAPVIEVAFLEGVQEPFLEAKDGWRMDGVEMKVRLDYAVGAVDYRGATTNAGA